MAAAFGGDREEEIAGFREMLFQPVDKGGVVFDRVPGPLSSPSSPSRTQLNAKS